MAGNRANEGPTACAQRGVGRLAALPVPCRRDGRPHLQPGVVAASSLVIPLLVVVAQFGCTTESEIGSPLAIELDGPDNGQVGEELSVRYDAVGRSLGGIVIAWGDGVVDSVATAGAQSASGTRFHTYELAGTFQVSARAEDSQEGVASAELTINIRGSQEPAR